MGDRSWLFWALLIACPPLAFGYLAVDAMITYFSPPEPQMPWERDQERWRKQLADKVNNGG